MGDVLDWLADLTGSPWASSSSRSPTNSVEGPSCQIKWLTLPEMGECRPNAPAMEGAKLLLRESQGI